MLSRLFIPKTLLDQGGIYARSLPDHLNQWTLQSYERHGLTGTLVGEPTEKDQFLYVDLKFTNAEFQSKLKDAFPNLQVLPDGSLRIETEAIFQAVADKCREQITHPNAHFIDNIHPLAKMMFPLAEKAIADEDYKDVAYFEPFYLKEFVASMPKKLL